MAGRPANWLTHDGDNGLVLDAVMAAGEVALATAADQVGDGEDGVQQSLAPVAAEGSAARREEGQAEAESAAHGVRDGIVGHAELGHGPRVQPAHGSCAKAVEEG